MSVLFKDYFGAVTPIAYGATGDGATDDAAAFQACFDDAFGTVASPHGNTNRFLNKTVYIPSGSYKIGTTLQLRSVMGGRIIGAGINSSRLFYSGSVAGGGTITSLIYINGMAYSHIEGLNLSITGDDTVALNYDWDNTGEVNTTGNTFADLLIESATTGFLLGNTGYQCDHSTIINVTCQNCTHAGIKTNNANALLQTIIGGGADGCDTGILCQTGSLVIYGTGFGLNNTWAIKNLGATPLHVSGSRCEGVNFIMAQSGPATISACVHQGVSNGTFLDNAGGGQTVVDGCVSSLGAIAAGNTNSRLTIQQSLFGRRDFLSSYTGAADLKNVYVGTTTMPSEWRNKRFSSSGMRTYDIEAAALTDASFLYETATAVAFTVTIATPAVFSLTTHGLVADTPVLFKTTGALPTGLSVDTTYYVISTGLTANAFRVSATVGGAAINTTGTQSGTHTMHVVRTYAVGDQVLKSNAAAGGSPGWICTTAGAAQGTAVFKALANVAG